MEAIESFIASLPKVELHVHLVGSASVRTVVELARRHPDSPVPRTAEKLREFYAFRDFPHFSTVYRAVSSLVTEAEDVADLVRGIARDLAAENVRYIELTVSPSALVRNGLTPAAITRALDAGADDALALYGVRVGYIFDFSSRTAADDAVQTLEHALGQPPRALLGFGIGGTEQARAAHQKVIRTVFGAAAAAGLRCVPHAGETTGPETIWEAIDHLHAERIGHGLNCLADSRLVAYLRESRLPLEVCPTSNFRTRQVADLARHPLPRMLAEGLFVTLNSDDPPMFGTTLSNEYLVASTVLGLGYGELAALAANAVRASFLDDGAKESLIREITSVARLLAVAGSVFLVFRGFGVGVTGVAFGVCSLVLRAQVRTAGRGYAVRILPFRPLYLRRCSYSGRMEPSESSLISVGTAPSGFFARLRSLVHPGAGMGHSIT